MKTWVYKVVLLGNSGVGKTTLFRKLKGRDQETEERSITDSIDLAPCTLEFPISESETVKVGNQVIKMD